jgi:hypothetical protein
VFIMLKSRVRCEETSYLVEHWVSRSGGGWMATVRSLMGGCRWALSFCGSWKATTVSEMGGLKVLLKALWGGRSNNLESVGGLQVGCLCTGGPPRNVPLSFAYASRRPSMNCPGVCVLRPSSPPLLPWNHTDAFWNLASSPLYACFGGKRVFSIWSKIFTPTSHPRNKMKPSLQFSELPSVRRRSSLPRSLP